MVLLLSIAGASCIAMPADADDVAPAFSYLPKQKHHDQDQDPERDEHC
jgi:hypothetical protein